MSEARVSPPHRTTPLRRLLCFAGRWAPLVASIRVLVEGDSMAPALAEGDRLLVSRLAYRFAAPERGDVVLLRDPSRPAFECIKRILALPGETVRLEGLVASAVDSADAAAAGAELRWQLGPAQYFVLGDNLAHSADSRAYGPVERSALLGRAWYRYASQSAGTGILR